MSFVFNIIDPDNVSDTLLPKNDYYEDLSPYSDNSTLYGYDNSSIAYGYDNSSSSSYGYGEDKGEYGGYGDSAYESDSYGGYGGEKKDYGDDFYYGAMSVAVLTLLLVVVLEAILHRVDMIAIGNPFNQAVLDAVYRECTYKTCRLLCLGVWFLFIGMTCSLTLRLFFLFYSLFNYIVAVLGIVELGVYIMSLYYEYDKNKKAVFADVHFLLFYTDIFNALQAVLQAYFTRSMSKSLWVRTEELELDHYVEIREEYDRVREELYGVDADGNVQIKHQWTALFHWLFQWKLKARYNDLAVQVRFHELRVYFLQAYHLPLKFKVSDYLMRSEESVLVSLVHISPAAWLWLTALCNVLYFFGGLFANATSDAETSAHFYSIIFFIGMFLFIAVSLLLDYHMRQIFNRIMYVLAYDWRRCFLAA